MTERDDADRRLFMLRFDAVVDRLQSMSEQHMGHLTLDQTQVFVGASEQLKRLLFEITHTA